MAYFSWSDAVRAAATSCLPCFHPANNSSTDSLETSRSRAYPSPNPNDPTYNRIQRARPDELQGLLADDDDSNNAETLSLHSNPGAGPRRKRKNKPKSISVFGFNLFGKPVPPPIYLGDDDDLLRRPHRQQSSSTFDSDAAQLDPVAIDGLSSEQLAERAMAAEAEERRMKEERRQRRRERKELKRAALALAEAEAEFEGFQGSGGVGGTGVILDNAPPTVYTEGDEFGPFVRSTVAVHHKPDDDEDAADLDGGLYTRTNRTLKKSADGSDSRSRTSASQSQSDQLPLPPQYRSNPPSLPTSPRPKLKSKSASSKSRSSTTTSTTSTSQSPSLASPITTAFPDTPLLEVPVAFEHDDMNDFDGRGFPSPRFGSSFPSPGLGSGKARDMGAFLATRGDAV